MSTSPKSKRAAPNNRFEDYTLTSSTEESLFPIKSQFMTYLSQESGFPIGGPGIPYTQGQEIIDIGFTFSFDNREYKKLYVSTRGFAILVDPTLDNPSPDTILNTVLDESWDNSAVRTTVWDAAHVILALWWDGSVINAWNSVDDGSASGYLSNLGLSVNSIKSGFVTTPAGIDPALGGVKRYNGNDPKNGNYLVIRWKSLTHSSASSNIAYYDLVLYESGLVEFRYSPRFFRTFSSLENATIAMFANGGSTYGNRYRDFSYFIREDSRGSYVNGGAIYDGFYTDNDGSATTTYTISLNMQKDWPGLDAGAIFKFSPPRSRKRSNRSITSIRDSASFVNRDNSSFFDDQFSIPLTTQLVEYPTMLPASYKVNLDYSDPLAVTELYASGSIQISRTLSPGLADSILYDSIVEGRKKRG